MKFTVACFTAIFLVILSEVSGIPIFGFWKPQTGVGHPNNGVYGRGYGPVYGARYGPGYHNDVGFGGKPWHSVPYVGFGGYDGSSGFGDYGGADGYPSYDANFGYEGYY